MSVQGIQGEYTGFSFNGIHSSALGITRVSNGSRYSEILTPQIKDTALSIPGLSEQYLLKTKYETRQFNIDFAFDQMNNDQLRHLKISWNDNMIHPLIFDESFYKAYSAKITSVATLQHIAYTIGSETYYAGTGSITFTCYYPFARSRHCFSNEYNNDLFTAKDIAYQQLLSGQSSPKTIIGTANGLINLTESTMKQLQGALNTESSSETSESSCGIGYQGNTSYNSGLLQRFIDEGVIKEGAAPSWNNNQYITYNCGDMTMPYTLFITPNQDAIIVKGEKQLNSTTTATFLDITLSNTLALKTGDTYIGICSDGILYGYDSTYTKTMNTYNEYISNSNGGTIKNAPKTEVYGETLKYSLTSASMLATPAIEYSYIYY